MTDTTSPRPDAVEGRGGPSRFAVVTRTRLSVVAGLVTLGALVGLAGLPLVASRSLIQDLFFIFSMLALAQLWNLLAGYAGLVSVGQQAFVGLGGYTLFAATTLIGLDPLSSILAAGVAAAVVSIPAALLVFRLRGAYFSIGTWVIAEILRLVMAQVKSLGGGTGTSLPRDVTNNSALVETVAALTGLRTAGARDVAAYWLALAMAVSATALVYFLLRSRQGLALSAIRDDEDASRSVGVDSVRMRLFVYVITASFTGSMGALIYLQKARISPDAAFSVLDWSASIFFIVIIGGLATVEGPIVGVLVFFILQDRLSGYGVWYMILLGGLAVVVMIVCPKGLWGTFAERFDLHLFPVRRRLLVNGVDPGFGRIRQSG